MRIQFDYLRRRGVVALDVTERGVRFYTTKYVFAYSHIILLTKHLYLF